MCLAPSVSLPAQPAPPPTAIDPAARAARTAQLTRQRRAGGYNGTLLTSAAMSATAPGKTLLGG
jgi:hypothetical protein